MKHTFLKNIFSLVLGQSSVKASRKLNATSVCVETLQSKQPPPTYFPSPWPSRREQEGCICTTICLLAQEESKRQTKTKLNCKK